MKVRRSKEKKIKGLLLLLPTSVNDVNRVE